MPNLLYAELERSDASRKDLVKKMIRQARGRLTQKEYITQHVITIHLNVTNGRFDPPAHIESTAATKEAAEAIALRMLLRNIHFQRAVAPRLQVDGLLHPQQMLEKIAKEQKLFIKFSMQP